MNTLFRCLLIGFVVYGSGTDADVVTSCYDDWLAYEGSCYHFGPTTASYNDGQNYCLRQHESYLIHVETADENTFIKHHLQTLKPKCWWTGLSDSDLEGTWTWSDTTSQANFTDRNPGQPSRDGNEDCVVYWHDFGFRWGDYPCTAVCPPICEMKSINFERIAG